MFFFFKQKTAYEMRISDWSSDVCSSDLAGHVDAEIVEQHDDRDREHDHADEQADQPHRVDDRLAAIMLGRGAVLDEAEDDLACPDRALEHRDRKSTRLNSSH